VKSVDLNLEAQREEIEVEHDPPAAVKCRECGKECPRYDHAPERQWQQLDVMQFAEAAKLAAPQAAIVYDKFHVAKHLNEAVDRVRREEHRRLLESGDDSLSGTKFFWLQGDTLEGERALSFGELCARNLKTVCARFHQETLAEFWAQPTAAIALDSMRAPKRKIPGREHGLVASRV